MKLAGIITTLVCAAWGTAVVSAVTLTSPDQHVVFKLETTDAGPVFSISLDGQGLIANAPLGLLVRGSGPLGPGMTSVGVRQQASEHDETYTPVWATQSPIRDHYRQLEVEFSNSADASRKLGLIVRAYDHGVAFRYRVNGDGATVQIDDERTAFRLTEDAKVFALPVDHFRTSYEAKYQIGKLSELSSSKLIGLPLTLEFSNSKWAAITEAHLDKYAGMYLTTGLPSAATAPATGMDAKAQPRTLYTRLSSRGQTPAVERPAPFVTPWRVIMLGRRPGDLIENNLVFNCNPPCAIADPSWIRPGKVIWDWWPKSMVSGVDFEGGMNTATMKHYIEFAGEAGLEYLLIDEGWSWWANVPGKDGKTTRVTDITRTVPAIDMPAILDCARRHGVRVWLWLTWSHCGAQMAEAFPLYEKWGIAGVKVDYMCRDDQWMVDWYHQVVELAARHRLMVDFHGAYKPEGIERTWPNLLTREGVLGLECCKWSKDVTPEHNVTLPFTRMLAGPMDYTPGGFNVSTVARFAPRDSAPFVMGTRCHQLAQYVVYFSPLQMCSDYPESYRGAVGFEFLRMVPTTWDRTVVIDGYPGEFIAMARQHKGAWYLGCMGNSKARKIQVPLSKFLGKGSWRADIFADGERAAEVPEQIRRVRKTVNATDTIEVSMAPGGGYAARFVLDDGTPDNSTPDTRTPDNNRRIRHVVGIAFNPELTAAQRQELLDAFDALPGSIVEIAGYDRGPDVSGRNLNHGLDQLVMLTFRSPRDLKTYTNHPAHQAFVDRYKPWLKDLFVYDYELPE